MERMWMISATFLQIAGLIYCLEPRGPVLASEPPNHVDFSNTTGKRLDCVAHGAPTPVIEWVRSDGSKVSNVHNLRQVLSNGTLYFPPFKGEEYRQDVHATVYRCLATNALGSVVSRDIKVRAVVKQNYEVHVYDEFVIKGNTAVLKCHIPSFVQDYVAVTSWIREDSGNTQNKIENGGRYSIFANGVLHIRDVRLIDGHTSYRCRTKHKLTGETITSTSAGRLIITDPKSSVPPRITHSRPTLEVEMGERAELPCAAQGYPVPHYSWQRLKDAVLMPVVPGDRARQLSGILLLQGLVQEDSATYVCFVNNSIGFERVETILNVYAPLSAYIQPERQVVDEGRPASFACSVTGFPVAFISWIKDGKHLVMNERVRLVSREVLLIEAVRREDQGMYQCLARNDHSSTQAAAELRLGEAPPVFSHTFPEQTMQPGRPVSLKCAASGSPTPQITWSLDDAPLPVYERFKLVEHVSLRGDILSYVNITKGVTEDGGEYRCLATNRNGRIEHSARLNIFGAPLVRPMPNVSAIAGSELVLRCRVAGHPIDIIRWERDGSILPINHRQKVFLNGTLIIQDIQRTLDAGAYTCVVINKQEATARKTVHVAVLNAPVINPFAFPSNLREGLRAGIQCLVIEGDQPVNITWLKDDRKLSSQLGIVTRTLDEFTSNLFISNITSRHTGNYTCLASNAVASVRYTAELLVNIPPYWIVEPKDSAVVLHETLLLDCQVAGSPMPSITWKKAMGKLPGDYKPVRQLGLNAHIAENGSLVVTNVREGHEGYYLCQASNGVGAELSKVVYVDIHVPAHFEMKSRNQTATKGATAALLCEVRGDLPLSIVWKYKGNRLDTSGDNRFNVKERATNSGLVSELLVSRIDRKDNGQYSCQATNAFGRDEAKIQLYVKEPPEAPKRLKSPEHSSRSVQLQWIPSFDGNSPVTRFIVQFKTTSETWHPRSHNITIPGHDPRAEVDTLRPAVTYQFRVLAENEVGTSDPSTAIAVTTSEEAPSGPPLDVQVDSPSSHSLRVRWKPPVRELWNGQIQGYRIGYRNVAAGKPYLFKTMELANEAALEYVLTALEKFTKYGITVEAFNREGSGPRASEVVASTLEDVPSEAPQFVQCKTLSSRSIQIMWNAPVTASIHGVLQGYRLLYIPVDPPSDDSKTHSTTALKTELHGLKKFTNYSLQVAAFNRAGVGRYSEKLYCRTEEDVPSSPAEIKALVMSSDAIIVSWRPPESPNGILTKYNVYMKDQTDRNLRPSFNTLPPAQTHYEMRGLQEENTYEFWVTASTVVGEGQSSEVVTQSPVSTVPAKIASFPERFVIDRKDEIRLPCRAVGIPTPDREWMVRGQRLQESSRVSVHSDGSMTIQNVRNSDAGNYTCRVSNIYATSEITHVIVITGAQTQKVPPTAPSLRLFSRTGTSISIKWEVEDDGGDPIQGFTLRHKQDSKEWKEVILGSEEELYLLDNLQCGTRYQLYLTAHNAVGTSDPSDVLTVSTKGQPPQIPERAKFLQVNSTYIMLDLGTWLDGGCPLLYFVIEYKLKEENEWHVVSSNVEPRKEAMTVEKLTPGTWYSLRVKAYNDAGASTVEYDFPTLLGLYGTDSPDSLMKKNTDRVPLFMDLNVLIPVISIAFLIILGVAVVCLVYQCRQRNGYKHSKATRNDIRGAPGGNDFSKRLAGGSSPAFTQLPSSTSARKPSSPSESPFSQPRYDEPGIHGDICPYATAQLSSCYTEDPASMQLKTFAVGGHKLDHMTTQQSEAPDSARVYAKPVKLLKSSENNTAENNDTKMDKKNSKPDQEIKQVWLSDKQEIVKSSPPQVKGTNSLLPSAPPAEYDSSPTDSDTPELGFHRKSVYTDDHPRPRLRSKPLHRSKIPDLLYHGGDSSSSNEESLDGDCKETSQNERVRSRPVSRRHSKASHRNSSPESTPEETSYTIRDFLSVPPEFSDRFANSENPGQKGIKSQAKEDPRRPTSLTLAAEEEELIALLRRGPTSATNPSGREEIVTRT